MASLCCVHTYFIPLSLFRSEVPCSQNNISGVPFFIFRKRNRTCFSFLGLISVFWGLIYFVVVATAFVFSVVHRAFFCFYSFSFCHRFELFRIIVYSCSVCEMWQPLAAACIHIWFPCRCSDSRCPVNTASAALRIFTIHPEREQDIFPAMLDWRLLKWWPREYQTASPSSQRRK